MRTSQVARIQSQLIASWVGEGKLISVCMYVRMHLYEIRGVYIRQPARKSWMDRKEIKQYQQAFAKQATHTFTALAVAYLHVSCMAHNAI
jgi:hypothetical protein